MANRGSDHDRVATKRIHHPVTRFVHRKDSGRRESSFADKPGTTGQWTWSYMGVKGKQEEGIVKLSRYPKESMSEHPQL